MVRSWESSNVWDKVAITEKNGELWVHCYDIGSQPLKRYHEGLTDIEWQFIV